MRYTFIVLTVLALAYNFWQQSWEVFFSALMTLVLFLMPSLLARKSKIVIPAPFQIIIVLFIFASMYLGEIHGYFYRYKWWDTMLHSNSAIILAYIGFLLIYTLNKDRKMHIRLSPFFMALFSFCFALTIGALWEIFEYTVDAIFGVNMQKARNLEELYGAFDTRLGVLDTMRDLIVDALGALFVSVVGYFSIKNKDKNQSRFWKLHQQFLDENPELFED